MMPTVRLVLNQSGRGRGLEAARDIQKGERIAAYCANVLTNQQTRGDPTYHYNSTFIPDTVFVGYLPLKSDGQVDECNACLINDWASAGFIDKRKAWLSVHDVDRWVKEYESTAVGQPNSNVTLLEMKGTASSDGRTGARLWAYAKRDIKAGEPLLWSYGAIYWLGQALRNADFPSQARLATIAAFFNMGKHPPLAERLSLSIRPLNDALVPYHTAKAPITTGGLDHSKWPQNIRWYSSESERDAESADDEYCPVRMNCKLFCLTSEGPDISTAERNMRLRSKSPSIDAVQEMQDDLLLRLFNTPAVGAETSTRSFETMLQDLARLYCSKCCVPTLGEFDAVCNEWLRELRLPETGYEGWSRAILKAQTMPLRVSFTPRRRV